MESLCIPSSTSLDEHTEFAREELYREIKKENCILAERLIQQAVLKFELIRMGLMKAWH